MSCANNNDENRYDQPQPTSFPEPDVPSWLEGISTDEHATPQSSLSTSNACPGQATLTPQAATALAKHALFIAESLGGNNKDDDDGRTAVQSVKSDWSESVDQDAFITNISGHKVDSTTSTVELNTVWSDGSWSWNPEIDVQKSVPDVVYRY